MVDSTLLAMRMARSEPHDARTTYPAASKRTYAQVTRMSLCLICKSAGTILALGADKLVISERAEFGPIDVQLRKPEEVGERTSGLTPIQALGVLENHSITVFKRYFRDLRFREYSFSTKMAADIATNITIGLLSPLYQQIDPIRLAEVERSLRIARNMARG